MTGADATNATENPDYLARQLITCIGNKRALLPFIGAAVERVRERLGRGPLSFFDAFSGSGIVSRYLRRYARLVVSNDLEDYAGAISRCYLANREEIENPDFRAIHESVARSLAERPLEAGFISELYAPASDEEIRPGERAFFTARNARFLDTALARIAEAPARWRDFLVAPLIAEASVHANTAGVFKGFYKDRASGIGRFGGGKGDSLSRILGEISLPFPVTSEHPVESLVLAGDANEACLLAPDCDVAYLDPPYNQHPYGSNYFMLNLIASGKRPDSVSEVSGIPRDWRRSAYNRRREAAGSLADLAERIRAKFLLVSFNSEGFIPRAEIESLLSRVGKVESVETRYNAFRGSRNLRGRALHLSEYLFIVEKR